MQTLSDAHKEYIRRTVTVGAEQLIAILESAAASPEGADIEKFMAGMYFAFGMGAPLPPKPDEPAESDDSAKDT